MARRSKNRAPPLKFSAWKMKNDLAFLTVEDLDIAIELSKKSEDELKRIMGAGFSHLAELREGKGLDAWAAYFVESALTPSKEPGRFHGNY